MPARELGERFATLPSRLIDLQYSFEQCGNLAERNSREDLPGHCPGIAITAANKDVVTLDGFAAHVHFHALQTDVAHVMLRARIRATGELNVDGPIERQPLIEKLTKRDGLSFGVRARPFAPFVARAGNESAGDVCRLVMKTHPYELPFRRLDKGIRDIGNQHVLPGSQAQLRAAIVLSQVSKASHLSRGHYAHRDQDADVVLARLPLPIHTNMAMTN